MRRRDFVRTLLSFLVAGKGVRAQQRLNDPTLPPAAPVPWTLGLNSQTPIPATELADKVATDNLCFFTPGQMLTLTRLSDLLLPPLNGKPGAVEAQTPMFLDFLIGSSTATVQKVYTDGLDWLEETAQAKHKVRFAQLDNAQADDIIRPWLRTWMNDHPPTEAHADFLGIAQADIRKATVNSEAWNDIPSVGAEPQTEEGIYWLPIEPDVYGENPVFTNTPPHVLAMPRGEHKIPVYSR